MITLRTVKSAQGTKKHLIYMKLLKKILTKGIFAALLALPVCVATTGCNLVNEDLPECDKGVRLRFVYDYNMEFANAFPSQVDCLTLLIYDEANNFVTSRTASAPEISSEGYRMTIDLPAGKYHFVAYGGMDCPKSSFHFTESTRSEYADSLPNLQVAMNSDCITSPVGTELHNLFYGDLNLEVPPAALDYTEGTVKMMRDTNDIKILLQQVNGEAVPDSLFDYSITADNTLLNYQNDPVAVGDTKFRPWTRGQISVGENEYGSETIMAFAQFSLSRIMADSTTELTITNLKNQEVLRVPLTKYLLALRNEAEKYRILSPQEYLDRENYWDMIFFLDSNWRWATVKIIVNGYVVRINDIDF